MSKLVEVKLSVVDIEPIRDIIDILARHIDDLPEELRDKIVDVLDRHKKIQS